MYCSVITHHNSLNSTEQCSALHNTEGGRGGSVMPNIYLPPVSPARRPSGNSQQPPGHLPNSSLLFAQPQPMLFPVCPGQKPEYFFTVGQFRCYAIANVQEETRAIRCQSGQEQQLLFGQQGFVWWVAIIIIMARPS